MSDAFFERSAATNQIVELLLACPEGGIVTYETMIKETNRDITRRDRHLLASALRIAQKNARMVFGTIRGVGKQRMRPNELMKEGGRRVKIIGRHAKIGGSVMDTAEMERLTADERLAHASMRGVLASIEQSVKEAVPKPNGRSNPDPVVKIINQ